MLSLNAGGWVEPARHIVSPNCNDRPAGTAIELLVIHNISLPPNQYGGPGVEQLFTNTLDPQAHPYYADIAHLKVSAHFFIRRDGQLLQFVPVQSRAWHAGVSSWQGREGCNDFSLGIELEGSDFEPFTEAQYACLSELASLLFTCLPLKAVTGHADIAPGRKTDPGPYFDWSRLRASLPIGAQQA
ncbi:MULTISPECIES: 1,6-anhydro-N-acetylmuramyl-L-alanine amidase AmpD [unclassified Paludibacterium]|uniref:1,6-anhydro-N-acetylmuramyl-L-alanine amidase AmpD n=1 Tax=unclassified Paludibacterium TaxID=2618429 RepID=UPI001C05940B|nr:1,6-anhydro-N-acetylmuramyl-L-alanine amidase AmpD [Paludibacterium sp. B53371]BEV72891.1 1,6-anhydro-N-acetylmuramyl-L-alanine amidase AmpD [Paludibacterium sp. THUN1379]